MPTHKVTAGGIGGTLTFILVWTLSQFGVDMPAEVATALTALIVSGAAYLKREPCKCPTS